MKKVELDTVRTWNDFVTTVYVDGVKAGSIKHEHLALRWYSFDAEGNHDIDDYFFNEKEAIQRCVDYLKD